MTREEAVKLLQATRLMLMDGANQPISDLYYALDMAIEALEQTELNSSEKPNNCEHITEDGVTCAKYPACDDCLDNPLNKVKGSERLVKGSEKTDCLDRYDRKTEPTISKMEQVDEPQTMLNDGTLVINVEDATKVSRVLVGDDKNRGDLYYPDDEDEPQTDCAWR